MERVGMRKWRMGARECRGEDAEMEDEYWRSAVVGRNQPFATRGRSPFGASAFVKGRDYLTTKTTRRFWARPASVLFEAIGLRSP